MRIAIDGIGYGDDGTVWGGEVFTGQVPDLARVPPTSNLWRYRAATLRRGSRSGCCWVSSRMRSASPSSQAVAAYAELGVIKKQVATNFNVTMTVDQLGILVGRIWPGGTETSASTTTKPALITCCPGLRLWLPWRRGT